MSQSYFGFVLNNDQNWITKYFFIIGTLVLQLNATDPDVTSQENLFFDMIEPITAVDKDGARVSDSDGRFKNYFKINATTGEVFVAEKLDRSVASIVTMTVSLTDTSADPVQV
jgi:hypothetical protein